MTRYEIMTKSKLSMWVYSLWIDFLKFLAHGIRRGKRNLLRIKDDLAIIFHHGDWGKIIACASAFILFGLGVFEILLWSPTWHKNRALSAPVDASQVTKLGMEYGYFQGQQEALAGKICIAKRGSAWVWVKSPWDNDTSLSHLLYHPELGQAESFKILMTPP
jgi:hypothetical protein